MPASQAARQRAQSGLLTMYTRVTPLWVRMKIKQRLSPATQARLLKVAGGTAGLLRSTDGAARVRFQRRHRRWLRSGGFTVLSAADGLRLARVVDHPTPAVAAERNLQSVTAVLESAGIPYFCVRGLDDFATAVAVPDRHRDRVARAFAQAHQDEPRYACEVIEFNVGPPRAGDALPRLLQRCDVVRVFQYFTDPAARAGFGSDHGCDVEFWREEDGLLHGTRPNRASDVVPADSPRLRVPHASLTRALPDDRPGPGVTTVREMLGCLIDDVDFPVDVVYTWVDGADPAWRRRRDQVKAAHGHPVNDQAANESRFINRDELRFSLRSVHQFAPWVRRIWLVTDDQVPAWLDTGHPAVRVVSHRELFAHRGALPTFNSHAIESQLHRIDGLAEHFLYLNDDVFFGRPVLPNAFFQPNGITKFFPSKAKVNAGDIDPVGDIPATSAGKNNRRIIAEKFGRVLTFKMKHTPHALRRSVMRELDELCGPELAATAKHQFRHHEDLSLTSSLYQYYAFLTGRAVIDQIRYMYADLDAPQTPALLHRALNRQDFHVFCLNDTDSTPEAVARQERLVGEFLPAYFPVAAPWEKQP